MQLRGGLIDHKKFLDDISEKMNSNDRFDPDYSLTEMSLESYTPKGNNAFINFYKKGALTATLLDIKLLELSGGKRGLREVFLELLKEFGRYKPFSEKDFFKTFANRTYPEIEQFINDYIKGSNSLPLAEYFAKLGFKYIPEIPSSDTRPTFGTDIRLNSDNQIIISNLTKEAEENGLKDGDIVKSVMGEAFTMQSARNIMMKVMQKKIGDTADVVIVRDGKEISLETKLLQRKTYHTFVEMENHTEDQKKLREAWSINL